MNNSMLTKIAMWGAVLLVLFMVFNKFDSKNLAANAVTVPYSQFLDEVRAKRIKEAVIDDSIVRLSQRLSMIKKLNRS